MPDAPAIICKGCWQQLRVPIPLRGVLSAPFRLAGIRPSRMNPNTCTLCEMMFSRLMRTRKISIEATVLFADIRNYTSLSDELSPEAMSTVLDAFIDECADAIWRHDGLLNKAIGDSVMAVFNFPIRDGEHAPQAVRTGRAIQIQCRARLEALSGQLGLASDALGVGVGIDTGTVSFGEFGHSHRDLTAIGSVVNRAARAQAAAATGQILVTRAVYEKAKGEIFAERGIDFQLKGFEKPVELFAA